MIELQWPTKGVRRLLTHEQVVPTATPFAVNVRTIDTFDRRFRGGSRPGLTKVTPTDMGSTIADLAAITVSGSTGVREILFVIADSTVRVVENGVTTSPVAYLTNEADEILTDEADEPLTVDTASAPASGFLVTGKQHVFAIHSGGIVKMDPKTGQTDTLVATAGTIPSSCTFGAIYRDRMCVSGQDNAIYMSRQGDYANWDFGDHFEDQRRAVPFQLSLAADVGAAPTALIPHKDDVMLAASRRSLWVIQGDPTTGALQRVSENVGIISSRAWCKIEDSVCFLAEDGLYRVSATGGNLEHISNQAVPDEVRNVNTATTAVSLGYEHDRKTIHVYLRTAAGSDTHWVYELETEAWYATRLQDSHSPLVVEQFAGSLVLAGADGFLRSVTGADDDGTAIESHVLVGPIRTAGVNTDGLIRSIHGMVAQGSGSVTWRLVGGDTAEQASDNGRTAIETSLAGGDFSSLYLKSGTWSAGRSFTSWPRQRNPWFCLWISSTNQWAYESSNVELIPTGRIK